MALLSILQYPDPRLYIKAKPVEQLTPELIDFIKNMFETMWEYQGIGLAATQVNLDARVIVIDLSSGKDKASRLCLINPEVIASEGTRIMDEGCLSFPGIYPKIQRADKLTIRYYDLDWQEQVLKADGLLATCIQHEIEHINGETFFDRLSKLKRALLEDRLKKLRRRTL